MAERQRGDGVRRRRSEMASRQDGQVSAKATRQIGEARSDETSGRGERGRADREGKPVDPLLMLRELSVVDGDTHENNLVDVSRCRR